MDSSHFYDGEQVDQHTPLYLGKQTFLGKKCPNTLETRNQEISSLIKGGGGQDNLDSILSALFPVLLFEKDSLNYLVNYRCIIISKKSFF